MPQPSRSSYEWVDQFRRVFDQAAAACQAGQRRSDGMFSVDDRSFLAAIGCSPQEMFDFADDFVRYGEPSCVTALLITAVRRQYFLEEMNGEPNGRTLDLSSFPPKDVQLGGRRWLPRLIAKAKAKLRGELPTDLMYGCGADRAFLRKAGWHPADFLRLVWTTGGDSRQILEQLKQREG